MGPTLGENVFFGQIINLSVESGLDKVSKVIEHGGFDISQFRVGEV